MKVLLVEDNERVTQFVVKGLKESGHTADHAANGRDGMFLAASEPYDVIIMDRMLPGDIDGLAIIEALRKSGKRTPILILSALGEVDDRIRGLRAGGDDKRHQHQRGREIKWRSRQVQRRISADEISKGQREQERPQQLGDALHARVRSLQLALLVRRDPLRHQGLNRRARNTP